MALNNVSKVAAKGAAKGAFSVMERFAIDLGRCSVRQVDDLGPGFVQASRAWYRSGRWRRCVRSYDLQAICKDAKCADWMTGILLADALQTAAANAEHTLFCGLWFVVL
jgi:hypothetical protein